MWLVIPFIFFLAEQRDLKDWKHYSQMLQVTGLNWQASKASETLPGVYKFELVRYTCIYICMEVGIIVVHAMHT